ncbi:hypothetical protein TVAG_345250 [Trichomonas vaginalis G3]|uniref:TPR Domain containing protein n=1 Tax=Trichomonas vaginalis (strain ATCC PRA-98 / G3) TaxID=412133 RepID=A2EW03_TRIV3|nr:tetratricopeptide repeat domain domain-containing protein [Trichomonas vaginalis G3]EAY03151.1 hypothetical protein TVAG_345250 [Trichomonas vaginalis G3]KAI5545437.1 tetratricopeptide repeat domain domain-containing protein [Trichomonas vaginalis G3]|eukprot:XP_001315374.1 hypothetical protein [Trichomonas vaginalis G3]
MNVRGINDEGDEAELQISEQSESFLAISKKFQQAVTLSPSEETEALLASIITDITKKSSSEYEKMLIFQCNREISRSKIQRGKFQEAISYLMESLKFDQSRTNLWADLAKCAQKTQNDQLYRAAIAKVQKLRPQLKYNLANPTVPDLIPCISSPQFISFQLNVTCWRYYLEALKMGHITEPNAILILQFKDEVNYVQKEPKYAFPENIKQSYFQEPQGKNVFAIGRFTILDFIARLGADPISSNTWVFNCSVSSVLALTLNKLAELRYNEPVPGDAAVEMIDLALEYVFDLLTPNAKLFYAELAAEYQIGSAPRFISGIIEPFFHLPNAFLRICYIKLEIAISQNRHYYELERLMKAFTKHMKEPVNLGHISLRMDNKLVNEKNEQIYILQAIDDPSTTKTVEMACRYFSPHQLLTFLSLKNVVKLFLQFDDEMVKGVLINFLRMLPAHIRKSSGDVQILDPLFHRFTYAMNDECVQQLWKIFITLNEVQCPKPTLFNCAIAYAYASVLYRNRTKHLSKMHNLLGSACHRENGRFLELLIDALINDPNHNEIDLTKAFGCYFSNVAISTYYHDSKLLLRCSPLMQPFYEHLKNLEDKGNTNPNNFFNPYLLLWMHYIKERDENKTDCCLKNIDGWRVYKVVKRNENKILKTIKLPKHMTTSSLLEDMLRNDPSNSPESRLALQKIIIKGYMIQKQQEAHSRIIANIPPEEMSINDDTSKLEEVLRQISQEENPTHYQKLIHAIVSSFVYHDKMPALNELFEIEAFVDQPKKEAKRIYWILRLMEENGMIRDDRMMQLLQYSLQFVNTYASTNKIPAESSILLLVQISKISGDIGILRKAIEVFCQSKITLPHPYVELAKRVEPLEAFKLLQKMIRNRVLNINNYVHFEYKVPFLMCHPHDIEDIKREIVNLFIDNAAKSGNYASFFILVHPSGRTDRKLSKVFRESRYAFGVDRAYIFVRYFTALIKDYESTSEHKKDQNERSLDALMKSEHILNLKLSDGNYIVPVGLRNEIKELQTGFLKTMWKSILNQEIPDGATINDFFRQVYQTQDSVEKEEEDDGEFVDDNDEEEDDDDEAYSAATATENDEEDTLEDDKEEEEEEDAEANDDGEEEE